MSGTADQSPEYWSEYTNLQHVKHAVIRNYLNGWFPKLALGNVQSARIVYIDTHAGRGKHLGGQDGSPLVALRTLLDHQMRDRLLDRKQVAFLLIERDESNAAALRQELQSYTPLPNNVAVHPVTGDAFELINQVTEKARLAPSFIFCDPYGFNIPGALLRKLMTFPSVELFLNVIWRELDMAIALGDRQGMARCLDNVFDGHSWKTEIASQDFDERAEKCANLFRKMTGAKWATYIRMLGDNGKTRYFLLHLTNSDDGRDLMKECVWSACPEGGYFARKNDDPRQQFLILPEPDLRPLKKWVVDRLAPAPLHWQSLLSDVRPEIWLPKHVNSVVRELRKEGTIAAQYEGTFNPKSNPLLSLRRES